MNGIQRRFNIKIYVINDLLFNRSIKSVHSWNMLLCDPIATSMRDDVVDIVMDILILCEQVPLCQQGKFSDESVCAPIGNRRDDQFRNANFAWHKRELFRDDVRNVPHADFVAAVADAHGVHVAPHRTLKHAVDLWCVLLDTHSPHVGVVAVDVLPAALSRDEADGLVFVQYCIGVQAVANRAEVDSAVGEEVPTEIVREYDRAEAELPEGFSEEIRSRRSVSLSEACHVKAGRKQHGAAFQSKNVPCGRRAEVSSEVFSQQVHSTSRVHQDNLFNFTHSLKAALYVHVRMCVRVFAYLRDSMCVCLHL